MLHSESLCISCLLLSNLYFLHFGPLQRRWHWRYSEGIILWDYLWLHIWCTQMIKIFISIHFFQEISVLSQCRCPYITEYYGSFLNQTKLWIIMEYMAGGSVADLVGYFYLFVLSFHLFSNASICEFSPACP